MKKFLIILVTGLLAFLVANVASDLSRSDGIDDPGAVMRYGFPFLYQTEGDRADSWFSGIALAGDILVAMVFSGSAALLCASSMSNKHMHWTPR